MSRPSANPELVLQIGQGDRTPSPALHARLRRIPYVGAVLDGAPLWSAMPECLMEHPFDDGLVADAFLGRNFPGPRYDACKNRLDLSAAYWHHTIIR